MGNVLFSNVRILDGTGAAPYPGEVLMQGDDLAVRVAGDSAALRKILATHRLFHFEQPLRFRRAKADEAP